MAFVSSRLAKKDVKVITEKHPIMKQRRCTYGSVGTTSSILAGKINFRSSVI
jgi:hypothetical protein